LYHSDIAEAACHSQELNEIPQRAPGHDRRVPQGAPGAEGFIKHPLWNFQRPSRLCRFQSTTKHCCVVFINLSEDEDASPVPRVPPILKDACLGNVGFIRASCIIQHVGTRRLVTFLRRSLKRASPTITRSHPALLPALRAVRLHCVEDHEHEDGEPRGGKSGEVTNYRPSTQPGPPHMAHWSMPSLPPNNRWRGP
jgi:hypothetical protein